MHVPDANNIQSYLYGAAEKFGRFAFRFDAELLAQLDECRRVAHTNADNKTEL
jgi:hypothetical protein